MVSNVPVRVADRLGKSLRQFQTILADARQRDINEADTVTIVKDMLADIWGYDKYAEVTSEHAIRGTFCDLAVQVGGSVILLIEVKAIGLSLRDQHTKQAVDYAANKGIEWVALTSGAHWHLYKVSFGKPIQADLVVEFDLLELDSRKPSDIEMLFVLSREGMQKSALEEYHLRTQAMDRFLVAAVTLSDPVVQVIRRELRRVNSDISITAEEIAQVLRSDVLKRDVLDGEKALQAGKRVSAASTKALRQRGPAAGDDDAGVSPPEDRSDAASAPTE